MPEISQFRAGSLLFYNCLPVKLANKTKSCRKGKGVKKHPKVAAFFIKNPILKLEL